MQIQIPSDRKQTNNPEKTKKENNKFLHIVKHDHLLKLTNQNNNSLLINNS